MASVKKGDIIRIHYSGRLEDGTVFDSSEGGQPLEFTVGEGEVIPGLEQGVIGMTPGEVKTIRIPMELGYGPCTEEKKRSFKRGLIPDTFNPEVGHQMQFFRADGMPVVGTVVEVTATSFTLDFNHPLAGKTLIFDTTLVEIV